MTWQRNSSEPRVEREVERYHYTECGLDNIYLVNGFQAEELDGDVYTFVNNPDMLHRVISIDLAHKADSLSGREIRFLRKEMNLTQSELAIYFDVTAQTVARWEKGEVDIPRASELLLRALMLCNVEGTVDVFGLTEELSGMDRPTRRE